MQSTRYAIYFAPAPTSPLWAFGSACLGYDAETGLDCPHLADPALKDLDFAAITAEPRHYGFHATLKAPFHLAEGTSEAGLIKAAEDFVSRRSSFRLDGLRVESMGRFLALVPIRRDEKLQALADDCVRYFERFRAPLSEVDMARRLATPLGARQKHYLATYGYPHVFEEFRFHMTLTGSLDAVALETLKRALAARYAAIDAPVPVDGFAIFRQPSPNQRFQALCRFASHALPLHKDQRHETVVKRP